MNLKPNAIKELRQWNEEQKAEAQRRQDTLTDALLAVVPKNLSKWRDESGKHVIENLILYGQSTGHKFFALDAENGDGPCYGYTDLTEFGQRFDQLKIAWINIVNITIEEFRDMIVVNFRVF